MRSLWFNNIIYVTFNFIPQSYYYDKQMYAHVENDQIMYLYFHNYGIFLQHEDTQSSLYNNNNKNSYCHMILQFVSCLYDNEKLSCLIKYISVEKWNGEEKNTCIDFFLISLLYILGFIGKRLRLRM